LKKIISQIFDLLTPKEKGAFFRLVIFDVVMSALDISFLALLLFTIHFYMAPSHLNSGSSLNLFNRYPLLLISLFLVLFSLKNLAGFLVMRTQYHFIYHVASRLSRNNLMKYLHGPYADYVNIHSSVHTRRINQQPVEFCHYVLNGVQQIISQTILILITITATIIYSPKLFFLLFLILTPPVILTGIFMKRKTGSLRKTAKPVSEKTLQYLMEALSGYVESNLYNRKEFFTDRYHAYQSKFNDFLASLQVMQSVPSKLIEVFAIFGLFILILINAYASPSVSIDLITIGAFIGAAYKIIPGIVKILNSVGQVKTYSFTAEDLAQDNTLPSPGRNKVANIISSIGFSGIRFSFKDEILVNNFCMTIRPGDFVGLTGASGSGKTTVINLLLGFLSPCSGCIRMNDHITEASDRQHHWQKISYVKQQPFLISDSILENIILDKNEYDAGRFEWVMQAAGLNTLNGMLTEKKYMLHENGKNISGGQRQRIAFARALYKNSDLYIFDEPFSEMDEETEMQMMYECRKLAEAGKMILLITHNKKSLSLCNKIVPLHAS
jgi:ABC-type bacteriocin/lantibiotic exporter with double-glycine peptidase domain